MLLESLSGAFQSRARPGLSTESVLLRPLEAGPLPAKELWRHGRVSKRAMRTMVNAAGKRGLIEADGDEVRLLGRLPPIEPASCPALEVLVSRLELEHPHFPVPYGTADPTFAGAGGGVDWKPVPRESGSSAARLPMTALLSQALVAFALEYESEGDGPIQWAANILPAIDGDDAAVTPAPKRGVHSVQNLQRLGIATIEGGEARLTTRGRAMRAAYEPRRDRIEARWRHRLGSSLIDEVVAAVQVDGDWSPFPLIAWRGAEFSVFRP